jgi:hypothetical protein
MRPDEDEAPQPPPPPPPPVEQPQPFETVAVDKEAGDEE